MLQQKLNTAATNKTTIPTLHRIYIIIIALVLLRRSSRSWRWGKRFPVGSIRIRSIVQIRIREGRWFQQGRQ